MIMFWNRHEVYLGVDMGRFNAILDILADGKVKYKYRVESLTARAVGVNNASRRSTMYYIYVHKHDADLAKRLIHQHR